ncbi:hypothetical protein H4R24_000864 [Coemansia sp. RSA 988]|nr:hypothetical protein H4R24_000864 [Coemansia sp. RSA 988]
MLVSTQAKCAPNYSSLPVETNAAPGTTRPIVPSPDNGYDTTEPDTSADQPMEYTNTSMDLTETDDTYEIISSATDESTGGYSSTHDKETSDGAYSVNSDETSDVDTGIDTASAPLYETSPSAPTSSPVENMTQESTNSDEDSTSDAIADNIPPPPSGYSLQTHPPYSNTSLDAPSIPENRR